VHPRPLCGTISHIADPLEDDKQYCSAVRLIGGSKRPRQKLPPPPLVRPSPPQAPHPRPTLPGRLFLMFTWTWTCSIGMDNVGMQHGHRLAALGWSYSMETDMQHVHI
jgi:hypothetical protein